MKSASRSRALDVLVEVGRGRFAGELLRPGEERFVRELVLGVLRRRGTLDSVLGAFSRQPLPDLEPRVRQALRAGLYQYLFMDGVPPHAAVSETVDAVGGGGKAYVNAVLRNILRESHKVPEDRDRGGASPTKRLVRPGRSVTFFSRAVFPDPEHDRAGWLAAVHSHPPFLVARWLERDPEEVVVARMQAANRPPPMVLRPRAGRCDAERLVAALARENVPAGVVTRPGGPDAVQLAAGGERALSGAAFRKGLFSVQSADQMDAAEILLEARPDARTVWDACAAPGGKACQLAERLEGREGATVLATDSAAVRLSRISENAARLGLANLTVAAHDLLGEAPPPGLPAGGGDAILLDAPCSNTAVLGARPEARWRLRPDTFARMAEQQARMIEAARRRRAPGGVLVYGVCSLEPEEGAGHGLEPTRSPLVFVERDPRPADAAPGVRPGTAPGSGPAGG